MVEMYRFQTKRVECDNQPIVQTINAMIPVDMYVCQVVQDIKWLTTRVDRIECRYIPRQDNQVAHHIAHGPDFNDGSN